MKKYEVGQRIEKFVNHAEGGIIDFDDRGAVLMLFMRNPSQREIESIRKGRIELTERIFGEAMWFTVKFDAVYSIDSPYTPHLSLRPMDETTVQTYLENDGNLGIALTVFLVNTANGEIKVIRLVGLGNKFSKNVIKDIETLKAKPFDSYSYDVDLKRTMSKYTTNEMKRISNNNRYRIVPV